MNEFDVDPNNVSSSFMTLSEELGPIREFIIGEKSKLMDNGFSEETSEALALKLGEFVLEGMISETINQRR